MQACTRIINRRLSTRSAITPPYGPSSRIGVIWTATSSPSAVPESVSVSSSQPWAMVCIQVPTSDTAWPP